MVQTWSSELVWLGRLKNFGVSVGVAIQRLVFQERVVHAAELKALLVGEIQIDRQRIFTLIDVDGVVASEPIWLPLIGVGQVRYRPRIQDAEPFGLSWSAGMMLPGKHRCRPGGGRLGRLRIFDGLHFVRIEDCWDSAVR